MHVRGDLRALGVAAPKRGGRYRRIEISVSNFIIWNVL